MKNEKEKTNEICQSFYLINSHKDKEFLTDLVFLLIVL